MTSRITHFNKNTLYMCVCVCVYVCLTHYILYHITMLRYLSVFVFSSYAEGKSMLLACNSTGW